ncbi:probable serine/threonine-protein kinase kinX [Apis mellifera]|uniref:Probable serine/threonine-protein kinase kinX n=1 Tax=Apis mellifera TaxID=7460 RepID=A0A7M7L9E8_APIME|nr:probable serine/threonine-protein kinase kinX [Apis mellifera]|eukprot:XP_026297335.1 probable serine/threonine-protein kinase kinX [Apis mellifera]
MSMEKTDDSPEDIKRATSIDREIKRGQKDDTFEGYPRIVEKKKRWVHCDKPEKVPKKPKHVDKINEVDCRKKLKGRRRKKDRFAMVSVVGEPCTFPKLKVIPRHCLTKQDYIDILATPSRKCPPECEKKMVLRKLKPVSQRIKELAQPTRHKMLITLQQGASILPPALLDNLVRTVEKETCLTPEQAATISRRKKKTRGKKRKKRADQWQFKETNKMKRQNMGITTVGSFERDSVSSQYLIAERFVRSILKWKCPFPKSEIKDIAEVIVRRLINVLEYSQPKDEDRKSQQVRYLADVLACWVTGVLFEVAQYQEEKLLERCRKKEEEMRIDEEEEEEEEDEEEEEEAEEEEEEEERKYPDEDDDDYDWGEDAKMAEEEEEEEEKAKEPEEAPEREIKEEEEEVKLEKVDEAVDEEERVEIEREAQVQPEEQETEIQTEPQPQVEAEVEARPRVEEPTEPELELVLEVETETESEAAQEAETETESEAIQDTETETEVEAVQEIGTEPESETVQEMETETEVETPKAGEEGESEEARPGEEGIPSEVEKEAERTEEGIKQEIEEARPGEEKPEEITKPREEEITAAEAEEKREEPSEEAEIIREEEVAKKEKEAEERKAEEKVEDVAKEKEMEVRVSPKKISLEPMEVPKEIDIMKTLEDVFKTDLPYLTFDKIIDTIYKMIESAPENTGEDPITNGIHRAIYEKLTNIVRLENPDLLTEDLKITMNIVCGKIATWLRSLLTQSQLAFMEQYMPEVESLEIRDWTRWLEYISDVAKDWNIWLRSVIEKILEMESEKITRGEWHDWTKSIDTKALLWRRFHLQTLHQANRNRTMLIGRRIVKTGTLSKKRSKALMPDISERLINTTDLRA